jgi:hypothetical protein
MSYTFGVMEPLIMEKQLPRLISGNSTPFTYGVRDMYNPLLVDMSNVYESMGNPASLPLSLTQSIDPRYPTEPQQYVQTYEENGIRVEIKGSANDVNQIMRVIRANPPQKLQQSNAHEWIDLTVPIDNEPLVTINRPLITIDKFMRNSNNLIVTMNNRKYSGSGIMLIVCDELDHDLKKPMICLLRSNQFNEWEDMGGKIDKAVKVCPDMLIKNAQKETFEESMKLFNVTSESKYFTDLRSGDSDQHYRTYCYLIKLSNPNELVKYFEQNMKHIYEIFTTNGDLGRSYREMNSLALFDLNQMVSDLDKLGAIADSVQGSMFMTTDNKMVRVRGRAIRAIKQLKRESIFDQLLVPSNCTQTVLTNVDKFNQFTF